MTSAGGIDVDMHVGSGAQLRASNTASITRIPVMATLSEHQCAARLLLRFRRQPDVIARNAKCNGDHLFFSSRVAGGHYNPLSVTTIRARICDLFDEVATAATPHFRLGRKSAVMYNITNGLAPGDIATLQVWRDTATMTQHYNLSAASRVAQEQRAAADARNAQPAPLSETRPTGPTATVGEIEDEISSQPTPPMGLSTRPVTGPSGSSALAAVPARVVRHASRIHTPVPLHIQAGTVYENRRTARGSTVWQGQSNH